jgi:hypothetical protein
MKFSEMKNAGNEVKFGKMLYDVNYDYNLVYSQYMNDKMKPILFRENIQICYRLGLSVNSLQRTTEAYTSTELSELTWGYNLNGQIFIYFLSTYLLFSFLGNNV